MHVKCSRPFVLQPLTCNMNVIFFASSKKNLVVSNKLGVRFHHVGVNVNQHHVQMSLHLGSIVLSATVEVSGELVNEIRKIQIGIVKSVELFQNLLRTFPSIC